MQQPRLMFRRSLIGLALFGAYPLMMSPRAAEATPGQTAYKIQPILRLGDSVGNIPIDGHFDIGKLNDRGQLIFVTENADGAEVLVQYSEGKLIPIVNGGADALEIWTAFARRGLGQLASTANSSSSVVTTSFVIPPGVLNLAVSTMVWPLMLPGLRTKPSALAPLASSALPCDSSLVMPMVMML